MLCGYNTAFTTKRAGIHRPFFFGRLHLELEAAGKQLQDGYRVFCTSGIELNTWHYSKLLNKP